MHAYATDEDRIRRILYLALLALLLNHGLLTFVNTWRNSVPQWVDAPSAMTLFGLTFWIFDRHVWRWKCRSFGPSTIPDLNGTWAGIVHSSFDRKETLVVVLINQTWTRIKIQLESEQSRSASTMASVSTKDAAEDGL